MNHTTIAAATLLILATLLTPGASATPDVQIDDAKGSAAVSVLGSAHGKYAAVSVLGPATGKVAVSGSDFAGGYYAAISGAGPAYGHQIALSVLGSATCAGGPRCLSLGGGDLLS